MSLLYYHTIWCMSKLHSRKKQKANLSSYSDWLVCDFSVSVDIFFFSCNNVKLLEQYVVKVFGYVVPSCILYLHCFEIWMITVCKKPTSTLLLWLGFLRPFLHFLLLLLLYLLVCWTSFHTLLRKWSPGHHRPNQHYRLFLMLRLWVQLEEKHWRVLSAVKMILQRLRVLQQKTKLLVVLL